MNELTSLGLLLLLLVFIMLMFFYAQARLRARAYRRGKKKFITLKEHLEKLRDTMLSESDRWPMYARPVLFTEIDREAQIDFARAQQALAEAEQIVPEIESIEEPELPDRFRLQDFFDIPKLLKAITLGNQLSGSVSDLEQRLLTLQESQKSLRMNRRLVEEKRLAVERSIDDLRNRAEGIQKRLKPLDVWRSLEAQNILWVVNVAERCQVEASSRLMTSSENDQGYIEHATATILVEIGNFSLDCIELFLESQKISRRYALDTFVKYFSESTGFLQSILQMEEVWSGWKKLKQVKPYIEALPGVRQQAEASLRSFKNRQDVFEQLIERLSLIDIEKEIEVVEGLEKEGAYYWYPYEEQKTYWEKALGDPTVFPSQELEKFRTLLLGEIQPATHVDAVIKQSQLLSLIQNVGQALVWHDTITRLILRLGTALGSHKEAQQTVNGLLASQGEAGRLHDRLQRVLIDTSPDLREAGSRQAGEMGSYLEQARKIRGVDFPKLLASLRQWMADAERLVRQHEVQFEELKARYDRDRTQIEALFREMGVYVNHIPPFDDPSIQQFDVLFDEGVLIISEQKVERYAWLSPAVGRMQAWLEKAEAVIPPARERYTAFESGNRLAAELLARTEAELRRTKSEIDSNWGWSRSEASPRIDSLARAFVREKNHWERIQERNWADYNIERAVTTCQRLITFCEGVLQDLAQTIETIHHRQDQLAGRTESVMSLLDQNGASLSTSDRIDIRSLVEMARETPDYDFANRLLEYAETMAMNRANPVTRNEITSLLQNRQEREEDQARR
jgi:hypothetical protein